MQKVIFSGIQPTGNLHLGNYLGAIKNWQNTIKHTENSNFFFSIVDLHAITIFQEPQNLRGSIFNTFAMYIACGIEGKNITVFQQSAVSEHAELAWILACNLQMGYLDRMTQYKEKTSSHKERACLGLYSYPVLMAADILLYNTNLVPVGEDQVQHIELTRDIAEKFNHKYGQNVFTVPEYTLTQAKRVMSLRDGTQKMSKSDESDFSRINLLDDADTIFRKIKKAKTGTVEIQNLSNIFEAITGTKPEIDPEKIGNFKNLLTDVIINELNPIQKKYNELQKNYGDIAIKMQEGGMSAKGVASQNLEKIYEKIGLK